MVLTFSFWHMLEFRASSKIGTEYESKTLLEIIGENIEEVHII